jgi:hypothetical protein
MGGKAGDARLQGVDRHDSVSLQPTGDGFAAIELLVLGRRVSFHRSYFTVVRKSPPHIWPFPSQFGRVFKAIGKSPTINYNVKRRQVPAWRTNPPAVNPSPSRPMKSFGKLLQRKAQRGKSTTGRLALLCAILLWLIAVGAGLSFLGSYENAPGVAAAAPSRWPNDSRIKPAPGEPTLVMVTHPHCPCTRASIEELDQLMAHSQGRVQAYVVLVRPQGFAESWVETDLWAHARRIPGVSVLVDEDGTEARQFRAETSGQVLLYGPDGRLLFSGGITGSRGHVGDNAGEAAIESLINARSADRDHSLVFGCPLFNPDSYCGNRAHDKAGN